MTQYKATAHGPVAMTPEEESAFEASRVTVAQVPQVVPFWKAKSVLELAGLWDTALAAVDAITDPAQRVKMRNLLTASNQYERNRPELVAFAKGTLGLTDAQIDQLFIDADKL